MIGGEHGSAGLLLGPTSRHSDRPMKASLPLLTFLATIVQALAAGHDPIILTAHQLSIATGKPSLVNMTNGTTYLPVWSLSGGTEGQSVAGLVALPADCAGVKVEIVVTTDEAAGEPGMEDVYRVHLSQMVDNAPPTERYLGNPVRTTVPTKPLITRTIVLESYRSIVPGAPLSVRIQREPKDPANTFIRPAGLALVKVTPLPATPKPFIVEDTKGYNSWPMMQAIGDKLVCVYSRGSGHTINEDARVAYARTSSDRGRTWTPETVVANTPGFGEVPVGKGLDSKGAALFWIRRVGKEWQQDLYRTTDGVNFKLIMTPKLSPAPVQITDIFTVPKVGLMCLWFSGGYAEGNDHAWELQKEGVISNRGAEIINSFEKELAHYVPKSEKDKILFTEVFKQLNTLIRDRRLRLNSVSSALPSAIWIILFLGAFVNIALTWCLVINNKKLDIIMNVLSGLLLGSLIFLIASLDNPYRGDFSVSPQAFQVLLDELMK